jgi:hypothetical protein
MTKAGYAVGMLAEEAEVVCVDHGVKRPCVLCSWKAPATT